MLAEQSLRGKRILVLGGSPREVIDGVRHYANTGRDQSHGARTAAALAALGATVTFITVKSSSAHSADGVQIIDTVGNRKITSTKDLLTACSQQASEHYDAVVQVANIASMVPTQPSDRKLKVKSKESRAVSLEVVGNVDVVKQLRSIFPSSEVLGYDNCQQWFGAGDGVTVRTIHAVVYQHLCHGDVPPIPAILRPVSGDRSLAGRKVIVTSGPTVEPITGFGDVITNFSSGRQGHAVAEALAQLGAEVVLVSGPTSLASPSCETIRTVDVRCAKEMHDVVLAELPADVFVGVAAVADFGMQHPLRLSLKEGEAHALQLVQNPDILQTVGTHASLRPSVVVGFAAETHEILSYARDKLERKSADFICANQVGPGVGDRDSSKNQVILVTPSGHEELQETAKLKVGKMIGMKIVQLLAQGKCLS